MARIMALDIGERRTGVAMSDPAQKIAATSDVLEGLSRRKLIEAIKDIVARHAVEEIVVGLPLNMDGSKGAAAQRAEEAAGEMRRNIPSIKVSTFDERLSTSQAENILLSADMSRKKRRSKIDSLAASIILQAYLDSKKAKENGGA